MGGRWFEGGGGGGCVCFLGVVGVCRVRPGGGQWFWEREFGGGGIGGGVGGMSTDPVLNLVFPPPPTVSFWRTCGWAVDEVWGCRQ